MSSASIDATARRSRRGLFVGAAFVALLVVLAGFSRSFYLRPLFIDVPLPLLVHLHGLVMSSWIALFLAQCFLVVSRRVALHRQLGVFGVFLAAAVVVIGAATAINAGRLGRLPPGLPPFDFLCAVLTELAAFAVLIGTGLALRRRPDTHKRLMLLGSLLIVDAAFTRILIQMHLIEHVVAHTDAMLRDFLVLVCIAVDTMRTRRLHPAFGFGAPLVFVSDPLADWIAATGWWHRAAAWMLG